MFRQYAAALAFGALIKTYDDYFDIEGFAAKSSYSEFFIELVKSASIMVLTYISFNNVNFAISQLIYRVLLYFLNKESLNNAYFRSGMLITAALSVLCFSFSEFSPYAIFMSTLFMTSALSLDDKLFPEDVSLRKLIGRSISIVLLIGVFLASLIFPGTLPIREKVLYIIGYLIVSVSNISFLLGKDVVNDALENYGVADYIRSIVPNSGSSVSTGLCTGTKIETAASTTAIPTSPPQSETVETLSVEIPNVSPTLPPSPPADEDILHTV
jgi:hypothetical protein